MSITNIKPLLLMADQNGNIFEHPELLMVCRQGSSWGIPRPDELIQLPKESELFLLPERNAIGLNEKTGKLEIQEEMAVAAFVSPAHTLTGHAAYISAPNAPVLPLFAYGAVGFAKGHFYVCAKKVDNDKRQVFADIPQSTINRHAKQLIQRYPQNRLLQHLMNKCALTYSCPAARNLCLGRFEAPLPVSRTCNARCIGCISWQEKKSPIQTTPQCRLTFTPTPEEIVEVMFMHAERETKIPIFSFGQGCEGEPLTEADVLIKAVKLFRDKGGKGTVNLNTNASKPEAITQLAKAGLTSIRVSLNSAREEVYNLYYRPQTYSFADVRQSILNAKKEKIFVSLNLLYFPGITDSEIETEALVELLQSCKADFIQLRNLNIDPELYLEQAI